MRPIPKKLKDEMAADPYYKTCARRGIDCSGRATAEDLAKYPRTNWEQIKKYLISKFKK